MRRYHVTGYLDRLRQRRLSDATLRLHLCAVRAVFDRLLGLEITEGVRHAPRPPKRAPAAAAQVVSMLGNCTCERDRRILRQLNVDKRRIGEMQKRRAAGNGGGSPWEYPSPRGEGALSLRTFRALIEKLAAKGGFTSNTTAVRMAPTLPQAVWDAAG